MAESLLLDRTKGLTSCFWCSDRWFPGVLEQLFLGWIVVFLFFHVFYTLYGFPPHTFPLCNVERGVTCQRSAINGDEGYVYTIVFEDTETNAGDQPMLTPSDTFTGTGSIRVSQHRNVIICLLQSMHEHTET